MHYQAPHARGFGGFVVLPIRPKPEPAHSDRKTGWLAGLFAGPKVAK